METYRIIRSDAIGDSTQVLQHYGVKGMKWGVRRTPEQLGRRKTLSERIQRSDKFTWDEGDILLNKNQDVKELIEKINKETMDTLYPYDKFTWDEGDILLNKNQDVKELIEKINKETMDTLYPHQKIK